MKQREQHSYSFYDGGQLAYLIGKKKTLFWNGHLGGFEGIPKLLEPKLDVAMLAIAGRANLNGCPFYGSAAGFIVKEIGWLCEPDRVI
jgi:hypothetical protein